MFGFITANTGIMTEEQKVRYRGVYCGLCLALKERFGNIPRLTLSYDMAFVIFVLSSMYEPEDNKGVCRCAAHPLEKHEFSKNEITDYVADMSVALAYFDVLDDWLDEKNIAAKLGSDILRKSYEKVMERYPAKCKAIEAGMALLMEKEKDPSSGPDEAAAAFGTIMGEVFAFREGYFTERLRAFGDVLGRFVFMMDAAVDLEDDIKKHCPNPFLKMDRDSLPDMEERKALLKLIAGQYAAIFEQLPLVQDVDIIRNVLYSGVWYRFEQKRKKLQEDEKNAEKDQEVS